MKFTLECDMPDGLVFIDESYLSELTGDLLYAMDILLDWSGNSAIQAYSLKHTRNILM